MRLQHLRAARLLVPITLGTGALACSGPQSSLAPAGREAERIADIFWWMTAGSVVLWIAMIALAVYVVRVRPERWSRQRSQLLIVGAGAVFPTIMLAVLLVYGLRMLPPLVARAPEGSLLIEVVGEQWWWRVRYLRADREPIETANEVRLPVGEPVQFRLEARDVIHSFWIPPLGGKIDMIPGRTTYLALQPTETGIYRGACAEYCGTSHALMGFFVEVLPPDLFERWLAGQAEPAAPPATPAAGTGRDLFFANGCSACHTIRGTPASGVIGPDLTHVGSRLSIGAAVLPNDVPALERWLASTDHVKPDVTMPSFGMLPEREIAALAVYLEGLE